MPLADPQLITFAGNPVTDHNRSPLDISFEEIRSDKRMANGQLRRYDVTSKHMFSMSWNDLPTDDTETVDGYWGAASLENFKNTTRGEFVLGVTEKDGTVTNYTVMIEDFSKEIVRRLSQHHWNVSISLKEV